MRPRGIRSKWVKILPWYYTDRHQPPRRQEQDEALEFEFDSEDT